MEAPVNTYVIDQFSDAYEKAMSNRKTMDEGRRAADFFRKLGWLVPTDRTTLTGRASASNYGKKKK